MRFVFDAYQAGLKFRRETKSWNEEQKRAWVLKALRETIRRAAETDYYGSLFREISFDPRGDFGFEDFAQLPILKRDDILNAGEKLVSKAIPKSRLLKDATGGTEGMPTEIWLGEEERGWKESGIDFAFEQLGVPVGSKMAYLWGHHLDPQGADRLRDRVRAFATNIQWFDCFRLSPQILENYHNRFEAWGPDCIVAYASALGQLAVFLKENGIRPKHYPKIAFVTGAEKLNAEHRKVIEEVFAKPVCERYGGRDFGPVAIQMNPRVSLDFEVDWWWALIEPETADETSPVLVTKFHADAMPMIRYRVGDLGKFPAGSKSGEPSFLLSEIVGRQMDRIWLRNGNWVSGAEFPHLLKSYPVREYVFVQQENYGIDLHIVPKPGFSDNHYAEIEKTISSNLEGLVIRIKLVEEVPRTRANKLRPVMTKVIR